MFGFVPFGAAFSDLETSASSPTGVFWDASATSKNFSLNGPALIATHSFTGTDDLVRANTGHTTGDYSYVISVSASGVHFVGLANATEAVSGNYCGSTVNSIGWFSNDGNIYRSGGIILSPAVTWVDFDLLTIRIKNGNLYLAKNGTYIGSMNPVAETGGIDVSGMGTLYPAASVNAGQVFTADFTNWATSSNNISGASSLTLSPSATVTGLGTLGGSSGLTITGSGTATGIGTVAGSSSLVLTPTGTATGLGSLTGTTTLAFAPTGTAAGLAALLGTSALTFAPSATATGLGSLIGSSTLVLTPTGTVTGLGSLIGSSAVTLTPTGTIIGTGTLAGTSGLTLAESGTATGIGALAGSSSITLTGAATLTGIGTLLGSTSLSWGLSGTIDATTNQIVGAAVLAFAGSATVTGLGQIAASTFLSLTMSGEMVAGAFGEVKVRILDEWQAKPIKFWDGMGWVEKPLKWWTGSAWQTTSY